jgi:hypothetical protein
VVVTLKAQYPEYTWREITDDGLFTTHDPKGDTLMVQIFLPIQDSNEKALEQRYTM